MSNTQYILAQAERLYNVKVVGKNILGNSANLIFELQINQSYYILRVSEYNEKKIAHIDFELKWINYLSNKLDSIVKSVKSINNNHYEVFKADDKNYVLCLFEKAKGEIADSEDQTKFNKNLFTELGMLMGNMHRLTMAYEGNIAKAEFEWYNNIVRSVPKYNTILDEEVQPFEMKYFNEISTLPMSLDNYGIIHDDIHTHNFFVDNCHIKLFDFDDCQFGWYASDIASTLFFMIQAGVAPSKNIGEKERTEFAETYLLSYIKGYTQTNTISRYWILKFDLFMRYRMTLGYRFVQNNWRGEPIHPHQWYLDWHKNRIINDLPYAHIDYEKIIASIHKIPTS